MIGPFSEIEEENIEILEHELIDNEIPYARMMRMYAEFLLALISTKEVTQKLGLSSELTLVAQHLRTAVRSLGTEVSDELRRPLRVELIGLCGRVEKKQPALAALTRCAVCCFSEEGGWEPDREEDPTPIPRYLFLLKRFDADIGMNFLLHARSVLLAAR
ncbi:hypothetical protein ACSFBX_25530 [Variovorax sp. RB2P76]|uniref:hypothetical protein n=1 Tax=Variovorax sp. RB2P76 TaxID=3443736 RepID=UPI003F45DD1A